MQMKRSWTFGHVPNGIAQDPQVEHLALQIICLSVKLVSGNGGLAVLHEHAHAISVREKPAIFPSSIRDCFRRTSALNYRRLDILGCVSTSLLGQRSP